MYTEDRRGEECQRLVAFLSLLSPVVAAERSCAAREQARGPARHSYWTPKPIKFTQVLFIPSLGVVRLIGHDALHFSELLARIVLTVSASCTPGRHTSHTKAQVHRLTPALITGVVGQLWILGGQ